MTLKISDSSQFSTNQTNLSNTPKKILVTLSNVRASSQEEAEAFLKALGFTQSDIEAFKDKYGVDLKTRFANEFSGKSSKVTKDASSKPGFQAYIGINSRNYKLLTGFLVERRAATKTPLPMKPTETAEGKKIYDNSAFQALKLKKLADKAQVETTSTGTPNRLDELRHFNVRIAPGAKAAETDKILSALIDETFGDRIKFAHNRGTIRQIAKLSGVELKNVKINGNRAEFDLMLEDTLKLRVAYNKVQDDLNRAEAVYRDTVDNNTFSQFAAGVFEGASDSIAGTANIVIDPVGTAKALWQVIGNPTETFNALYKELENTSDKFKAADHVERSRMIGKLLGSVITAILIGRGAGELGGLLKATKTGAGLMEKAEKLRVLTTAKIAEAFSDEAASAATNRLKQRLAGTQLYGGIPADALADLAVVATNKIKNGAVNFSEFSGQMIKELGETVRPKLLQLYQDAFEKIYGARKTLDLDELLGGHSIEKHVGKSDNWLRNRLIEETDVPLASSFRNYEVANRTISKFVKENRQAIEEWLKSGKQRLDVNFTMDETVGNILGRGKGNAPLTKSIETNRVRVSLVRDNSPQGWHVNTLFPMMPTGKFKY